MLWVVTGSFEMALGSTWLGAATQPLARLLPGSPRLIASAHAEFVACCPVGSA